MDSSVLGILGAHLGRPRPPPHLPPVDPSSTTVARRHRRVLVGQRRLCLPRDVGIAHRLNLVDFLRKKAFMFVNKTSDRSDREK